MAGRNQVREELAKRFTEALGEGQLPWEACWTVERPRNAMTGKAYRGVNNLYLSMVSEARGYGDPRWCTYRQAQEQGWQVRKGEKGAKVEYWMCYDRKQKRTRNWSEVEKLLQNDPDYARHLQLCCRVYTVFNAEQMDGVPERTAPQTDIGDIRQQRDTLLRNMNLGYRERGNRAYYTPAEDRVTLPPEGSFRDAYAYMATFLHECGHATGHPARLNRDMSGSFGSPEYAREELRAEIAGAFTAQSIGLQLTDAQRAAEVERHAAYVQSWAEALEKDPDEIFRAIQDAEKISDYLIEKGEFDKPRQRETEVENGWEAAFREADADSYCIYQLRDDPKLTDIRFMSFRYLTEHGLKPEFGNYTAVYCGMLPNAGSTEEKLDRLYEQFNVAHPGDFTGHSVSVSDVIVLRQQGAVSGHYVDSVGFKPLPGFLPEVVAEYASTARMQPGYTERIAILRMPDGTYQNHYGCDSRRGSGAGMTGSFETLEDARQDVLAHCPDAKEAQDARQVETSDQVGPKSEPDCEPEDDYEPEM